MQHLASRTGRSKMKQDKGPLVCAAARQLVPDSEATKSPQRGGGAEHQEAGRVGEKGRRWGRQHGTTSGRGHGDTGPPSAIEEEGELGVRQQQGDERLGALLKELKQRRAAAARRCSPTAAGPGSGAPRRTWRRRLQGGSGTGTKARAAVGGGRQGDATAKGHGSGGAARWRRPEAEAGRRRRSSDAGQEGEARGRRGLHGHAHRAVACWWSGTRGHAIGRGRRAGLCSSLRGWQRERRRGRRARAGESSRRRRWRKD